MIDGINFIKNNYGRVSNLNNSDAYKDLYHPDILWCPPGVADKRGSDLVAFCFSFKNLNVNVEIIEIEGINSNDCSYVTGVCRVDTYEKNGSYVETLTLRGSWVVVNYNGELKIRYQIWNQK